MMVVTASALYLTVLFWIAVAVVLTTAANYFVRPKTRDNFPGGKGRYLAALLIQATGFIAPIPFVILFMLGPPTPDAVDVVVAVGVGVGVIYLLRALPLTGPLLKDLHRARLQAAMQRLEARQ